MAKILETENNVINQIGVGTEITGDVSTNGDIRIDGNLNGNLKTKGKLVIGETEPLRVKSPAKTPLLKCCQRENIRFRTADPESYFIPERRYHYTKAGDRAWRKFTGIVICLMLLHKIQ